MFKIIKLKNNTFQKSSNPTRQIIIERRAKTKAASRPKMVKTPKNDDDDDDIEQRYYSLLYPTAQGRGARMSEWNPMFRC
jgi:hypothetical protein